MSVVALRTSVELLCGKVTLALGWQLWLPAIKLGNKLYAFDSFRDSRIRRVVRLCFNNDCFRNKRQNKLSVFNHLRGAHDNVLSASNLLLRTNTNFDFLKIHIIL